GDCLHFMQFDEHDLSHALEERRYEAEQNYEPFDWNQEKQLLAMSTQGSKH
ncbi:PA2817 family protein, partial [Pseudomonas syringae pv. tagetis]